MDLSIRLFCRWNNMLDAKLRNLNPFLTISAFISELANILLLSLLVTQIRSPHEVDEIKGELHKDFPIKEIGKPGKFPGCHIL
jgi:hypothetical protein